MPVENQPTHPMKKKIAHATKRPKAGQLRALGPASGPAGLKRKIAAESGEGTKMPGLAAMTKKQMAALLQSLWGLCDETFVPTHNGQSLTTHYPPKRGGMSLYGRVYCALIRRNDWSPNK